MTEVGGADLKTSKEAVFIRRKSMLTKQAFANIPVLLWKNFDPTNTHFKPTPITTRIQNRYTLTLIFPNREVGRDA